MVVYYAFTCHLQIGWVFHKLTAEHVWNLVKTSCIKSSTTVVEKWWLFGVTLIDCNRNPIIKLSHKFLQDTKEVRPIKMTFTLCPIQTQWDYNLSLHKLQHSVTHWQPLWIYFMFNMEDSGPMKFWKLLWYLVPLHWLGAWVLGMYSKTNTLGWLDYYFHTYSIWKKVEKTD